MLTESSFGADHSKPEIEKIERLMNMLGLLGGKRRVLE